MLVCGSPKTPHRCPGGGRLDAVATGPVPLSWGTLALHLGPQGSDYLELNKNKEGTTLNMEAELETLKGEIISSMAKVEDAHHRVVLSLMVRIMITQERFTKDIFEKLDTIIRDEDRIKEIALNGDLQEHSSHHNWVREKMARQKEDSSNNREIFRSTLFKGLVAVVIFILGHEASVFFPHLFGGK